MTADLKPQSIPVLPWAQANSVQAIVPPSAVVEGGEHVEWTLASPQVFTDVDGDVEVKAQAFMPLYPANAAEASPETLVCIGGQSFTVHEASRLAKELLRLCHAVEAR